MKTSKSALRVQRKRRVRGKISGTADRPRLSIFRSLRGVSAQVIDDLRGMTLVSVGWKELSVKDTQKKGVDQARELGEILAKKCVEKKVSQVVFDRNGYKYHGKVQAFAEGVRKGGILF